MSKSPLRSVRAGAGGAVDENGQTVTLGNMANPSKARVILSPEKTDDGQPSGYKSLRDKSPAKTGAGMDAGGDGRDGDSHSATRFATVSIKEGVV